MQHLNTEQREAVRYHDGPLLVLAGAGSGKTGVVAQKIAHLIAYHEVPAEQIAAITFTNKAAREMRERVKGLIGKSATKPWISTFHTLGLRIVRESLDQLALNPGFSIFDAGDAGGLIADLMRREAPGSDIAVSFVQQQISAWKYDLVAPENVDVDSLTPQQKLAHKCYAPYCDTLLTYNAVDFDDLIRLPVKLLSDNDDVLARWREQIAYLLVDEYQDTNLSQYELVRLLAAEHQRLTAVGDDDQSIYAWRGARPENIHRLDDDFARLKVIKLEQNYRSTGIILKAANTLIANNPHLLEKKLWSSGGFGDKIRVFSAASEQLECEKIANDILHRRLIHGAGFADFAVLIRSNFQARGFEHAFRERDIPYVLSGGKSFFDYSEIKDCVCYLRLIANTTDNNALLRVINTPRRAIGTQTVKTLAAVAGELDRSLLETAVSDAFAERVSPAVQKRVGQFAEWVFEFQRHHDNVAPVETFDALMRDINFDDWLEQSSDDEAAADRRKQNVAELRQWIKRIQAAEDDRTIADVVAALTLFDIAERQDSEADADGVALTTLHAAKGLEYPHVYLAGFEENLLPHRSSIEQDTIEEERRLAYVGVTRAKKTLAISYARTRKRYGQLEEIQPSRFLEELPSEELSLEGQQVDKEANREAGRGTLDNLKRLLEQ